MPSSNPTPEANPDDPAPPLTTPDPEVWHRFVIDVTANGFRAYEQIDNNLWLIGASGSALTLHRIFVEYIAAATPPAKPPDPTKP